MLRTYTTENKDFLETKTNDFNKSGFNFIKVGTVQDNNFLVSRNAMSCHSYITGPDRKERNKIIRNIATSYCDAKQNVLIFTKQGKLDHDLIRDLAPRFSKARLFDFEDVVSDSLPLTRYNINYDFLNKSHYFIDIINVVREQCKNTLDKRFIQNPAFDTAFDRVILTLKYQYKNNENLDINIVEFLIHNKASSDNIFAEADKFWSSIYNGSFSFYVIEQIIEIQNKTEKFFQQQKILTESISSLDENVITVINLTSNDILNSLILKGITLDYVRVFVDENEKNEKIKRINTLLIFDDCLAFESEACLENYKYLSLGFLQMRSLGFSIVLTSKKDLFSLARNTPTLSTIFANIANYFMLLSATPETKNNILMHFKKDENIHNFENKIQHMVYLNVRKNYIQILD